MTNGLTREQVVDGLKEMAEVVWKTMQDMEGMLVVSKVTLKNGYVLVCGVTENEDDSVEFEAEGDEEDWA